MFWCRRCCILALSLALWCWTVLKYSGRTGISFRASKVFLEWNQLECLWPCCHSYQMLLGSDAWYMTYLFRLQVTSWKCKSPSWPHLRETLTFYLNYGMTRQCLFSNQSHVILLEYQMCYTKIPDRALKDQSIRKWSCVSVNNRGKWSQSRSIWFWSYRGTFS